MKSATNFLLAATYALSLFIATSLPVVAIHSDDDDDDNNAEVSQESLNSSLIFKGAKAENIVMFSIELRSLLDILFCGKPIHAQVDALFVKHFSCADLVKLSELTKSQLLTHFKLLVKQVEPEEKMSLVEKIHEFLILLGLQSESAQLISEIEFDRADKVKTKQKETSYVDSRPYLKAELLVQFEDMIRVLKSFNADEENEKRITKCRDMIQWLKSIDNDFETKTIVRKLCDFQIFLSKSKDGVIIFEPAYPFYTYELKAYIESILRGY